MNEKGFKVIIPRQDYETLNKLDTPPSCWVDDCPWDNFMENLDLLGKYTGEKRQRILQKRHIQKMKAYIKDHNIPITYRKFKKIQNEIGNDSSQLEI